MEELNLQGTSGAWSSKCGLCLDCKTNMALVYQEVLVKYINRSPSRDNKEKNSESLKNEGISSPYSCPVL